MYVVLLRALLSTQGFGACLKNGNFLLASGNLVVQVTRNGDVVDGLFPPTEDTLAIGVEPCGDIVVGAYERLTSYAIPDVKSRRDILVNRIAVAVPSGGSHQVQTV